MLEEDLALANVALDLLGQARLWLSLAGDEDALAYLRDGHAFTNVLLVEQPNGDYAHTMVRQFLFDAWHLLLLQQLSSGGNIAMAEIATKAATEVAYHLRRSRDWVVRLGDGTEESHQRMAAAVASLWPFTGELFLPDSTDAAHCDLAALRVPWLDEITRAFTQATLVVPTTTWCQTGGKQGRHTEHLGHLLAEMQFLQRAYPGAAW